MALQLLASVNGGAPTHGVQSAAFGQTLAPSVNSTSGLNAIRYEIYDFPTGFTVPAGWSTDTSGVYYYAPSNVTTTPPTITLPSSGSTTWGWFMLRVRGNNNPLRLNADGSPNGAYDSTLTDEGTAIYITSPNAGMKGLGFNLTTQDDALRSWVGDLMQSLRQLDVAIASSGGTGYAHITGVTTLTNAQRLLDVDTSTGAFAITMPPSPTDGQTHWFDDIGSAAGSPSWGAHHLTVTANSGQQVENPASLGTYSTSGGSVVVSGAGGDFGLRYVARTTSWKAV